MTTTLKRSMNRRRFLSASAAASSLLAAPALAQGVLFENGVETAQRNMSSFRAMDWRTHFSNLRNGAILVDIQSRALHFWSEDQTTYKLYPTSVPLSEDLTRRGRTRVTQLVEGPSWRPTPNMKKRNPEWPDFMEAGPDNPMGSHALYLSWQFYRIHGTHDTRKIGRRSSNGCIGLYNQHIAELHDLVEVGTQVLLI